MGDDNTLAALETRLSDLEKRHRDELAEKDQKITEANNGKERAEDALAQERSKSIIASVMERDDVRALKLPERAAARIESDVLSQKLPIVDGEFDREVFEARILKAVKEEHDYLKPVSERGKVTDVGGSNPLGGVTVSEGEVNTDQTPLSEAEKAALQAEFRAGGMSEEAAKAAAEA